MIKYMHLPTKGRLWQAIQFSLDVQFAMEGKDLDFKTIMHEERVDLESYKKVGDIIVSVLKRYPDCRISDDFRIVFPDDSVAFLTRDGIGVSIIKTHQW